MTFYSISHQCCISPLGVIAQIPSIIVFLASTEPNLKQNIQNLPQKNFPIYQVLLTSTRIDNGWRRNFPERERERKFYPEYLAFG